MPLANTVLWVVQIGLALLFLASGGFKTATPADELVKQFPLPIEQLRLAGASEIAGALGLTLPLALGIQPWLTPLAATLLGVVMLLATAAHVVTLKDGAEAFPFVLAVLCFAVAYGRRSLFFGGAGGKRNV
jgi:hypothetical protein